jgi:hypothetical protein
LQISWFDSNKVTGIEENIILEGIYDSGETIYLANLTKDEVENITGKTREELIGKVCVLELYSKVVRISKINKKNLLYIPLRRNKI